jgi:hypothetical protein
VESLGQKLPGRSWLTWMAAGSSLRSWTIRSTSAINGGVLFNKHVMVSAETVERKYADTGEVDDVLVKQLGIKKNAESVRELFNGLGMFVIGKSPDGHYSAFSREVDAVWDKGERLGLW